MSRLMDLANEGVHCDSSAIENMTPDQAEGLWVRLHDPALEGEKMSSRLARWRRWAQQRGHQF